ncbi:YafY family protein [Thalassospira sp. TSL5-1]|uniref:helix-turn-helix transcriptional regulator n=1 Tax=Thalassospira sp. TSL5-1 TaxID=1544451 RepID=UPI000939E4E6|nr:YafY family protein [Thalassospira sp. TSL5-1]OKH86641.1 DNA-binding protein [Thalassospira sp. TSL5-1]
MSRAERLLELMQLLRHYRLPVSGRVLASELGISLRTLYRDIAALQAQGAVIEGEPGIGYVLRPGFMLPPLMFSEEEIEALILGTRWVTRHADKDLAVAAGDLIAKVTAVLPSDLQGRLEISPLFVGSRSDNEPNIDVARIRDAIRREHKISIAYRDENGAETRRTLWPVAIGFFEQARIIAAWCETRQAFRHFRTDRIVSVDVLEVRYPQSRRGLLQKWRQQQGIT